MCRRSRGADPVSCKGAEVRCLMHGDRTEFHRCSPRLRAHYDGPVGLRECGQASCSGLPLTPGTWSAALSPSCSNARQPRDVESK